MKILRWKYVVPRLLIAATLVATVRFGLDPLLHYVIVTASQSATGAKVELAAVETSLLEGRVELRGLQVANPQSLLRNLFEAERTQLSIDTNALFHKRLVIENGEITGLAIDTARTESGELEIVVDSAEPSALDPLLAKASDWAGDWFEQAGDRLDSDFADELQTPQVAKALEERWKQQASNLRTRAEELKSRGKQLEAEFREVKSNPLRGIERLPALQAQLKTVQQELASLQTEIKNFPNQVKKDRHSLNVARQADEAFIKQQLKFGRLDGDNLTQVLLGQSVAAGTQGALDWIGWARHKMPTNSTKQIAKQRSRGTVVSFGTSQPQLHIQQLGLELTAPVAGQSMQFTGSLTNISDQPRLISEPARLQLIASGDIPVTLEVLSDRRSDTPREELFLVCSALPLAGQTLGNQNKLAMQLAPGTANLRVELTLTGDELNGHITFQQPNFHITPLANANSNQNLVAALTQALDNIHDVSAEIQLTGTLKRPEIKLQSPLGKQLADGISTAVVNLASQKSEALLAKVSGQMNEQLAKLESTKANLEQELLAKLGENQQLFESLASLGGSGNGISVPQLGSLGSGVLRK
ncbi:MAG: TIGR03545 family protein [Bythopirellula sp.]|nr:TIGR03545 family protein [Bythopirellula sp.]